MTGWENCFLNKCFLWSLLHQDLSFRRTFTSFLNEHVFRNRKPEEIKLVKVCSPCGFYNFLPIEKLEKLRRDGAWDKVLVISCYLLKPPWEIPALLDEAPGLVGPWSQHSDWSLVETLVFFAALSTVFSKMLSKVPKNLQSGSMSALRVSKLYF